MISPIMQRVFLSISFVIIAWIALSCSDVLYPINVGEDGIAIKGYDPVAYFDEGKPLKGSNEHSFEWQGATWLFASNTHLDIFRGDPAKYAPQYGGYCAYAVSRGTTADIDPNSWTIVDSKLYLNLNKKIQSIWMEDMLANIEKADRNWPDILNK